MSKMSILVILLIIVLCVFLCALITYDWGWWPTRPPQREFSREALLLSEEDLGGKWRIVRRSGWDQGSGIIIESTDWHFAMYNEQGKIVAEIGHFVHRFDNKQHARGYFNSEYLLYYKDKILPMTNNFFQPKYADNWFVTEDKTFYIATYDEFMIALATSEEEIKQGYITYEQLSSWFREMDERAGRLLGKSK